MGSVGITGYVYNTKYFIKYKNERGTPIECKILLGSDPNNPIVPTPVEVKAPANSPLVLKYSGEPIKTSKLRINLIYSGVSDFTDLFTNDPYLYKVELYEGTTKVWEGYLDTETYSSPIKYIGYTVTLYANDGISLLKRVNTLNEDLSPVDDNKELYSIHYYLVKLLKLAKVNITKIAYNTTLKNNLTGYGSSIVTLTRCYCVISNFFKNSGDFMNTWELLTEILKAFGLTLVKVGTTVYIYDKYAMYTSETYQLVDFSEYPPTPTLETKYNTTIDLGRLLDANLSIEPSKNKYSLTSSLYYKANLANIKFDANTVQNYYSQSNYTGLSEYSYNAKYYHTDKQLTDVNQSYYKLVEYTGTGTKNNTKKSFYLSLETDSPSTANEAFKLPLGYVVGKSGGHYGIKVKVRMRVRTKDYPDAPDTLSAPTKIDQVRISPKVKVGNYYLYGNDSDRYNAGYIRGLYSTSVNYYPIGFYGDCNDTIKEGVIFVRLDSDIQGQLEITFNNYFVAYSIDETRNRVDVTSSVKAVEIYDIEVRVVDLSKPKVAELTTEDDTDTTYRKVYVDDYEDITIYDNNLVIYNSDDKWLNEDSEIKTIIGTNYDAIPTALGSLFYLSGSVYKLIDGGWVLNPNNPLGTGYLEHHTLYERYLQSKSPRYVIEGKIRDVKLSNNQCHIGYYFDDIETGKRYEATEFELNYQNGSAKIVLTELKNY